MDTRLHSIAPQLALRLAGCSETIARAVVYEACRRASRLLSGGDADVSGALEQLGHGGGDVKLKEVFQSLGEQRDEQYLALNDEDSETLSNEATALFRQARAAFALAYGLSDSRSDTFEAVYEALSAETDEDQPAVISELEKHAASSA